MVKNSMRIAKIMLLAIVCVGLAPVFSGSRAAAQGKGEIKGVVKDTKGKPLPDVTIVLQMAGSEDISLTSDKDGKFGKPGLKPGTYRVIYKVSNEPNLEREAHVQDGKETNADLNMADPEIVNYIKARKEEAENEAKFGKLKAHVDAGIAALQQEQALRDQITKAPADQRPALQEKLNPLANTAIDEFKQALTTLQPTEVANLATVLNDLGTACDAAGRYDEAAQYYQQSATVKPDAGTYNNLGIDLAKAGKFDDAKVAYEKSAELDPAGAARAYRNFGAVAYNAGKLQGPVAVELLKKATDLDPKNPQGWFLYGAALVANMQVKQEGEKMTFIIVPGTVEAYEKCIELDPNGPFGAQAKAGLEELKAMGVGIDTKVTAPRVKH